MLASIPPESKEEPSAVDTPKRRRSSRSRTKSPEPIISKAQDPTLSAVAEEPEEVLQEAEKEQALPQDSVQSSQPDSQMYEKIIDEMEVDETPDDVNETNFLLNQKIQLMLKPKNQCKIFLSKTRLQLKRKH